MTILTKPSIRIYEPRQDPNDPRIKHIILPHPKDRPIDIGIIGVPFDAPVVSGGGRGGARYAPGALREALKHYGTTFNIEHSIDISDLTIVDYGDVAITDDTETTHERITEAVSGLLKQEILPIVIGGGHDTSIGTVRALSQFHSGNIGGISVDAHFDVREIIDDTITSGTPFRKLLDTGLLSGDHFFEIGAHDNLNARVYYDYLMAHKVSVITLADVTATGTSATMETALATASSPDRPVFVSIDIDAVAQCFAPGCSAPDARGLNPDQIREIAFLAGASPAVQLLDIVEINPEFDVDNRTARLGASLIISFLNGFATRRSA